MDTIRRASKARLPSGTAINSLVLQLVGERLSHAKHVPRH